jgi:hypothetical protein
MIQLDAYRLLASRYGIAQRRRVYEYQGITLYVDWARAQGRVEVFVPTADDLWCIAEFHGYAWPWIERQVMREWDDWIDKFGGKEREELFRQERLRWDNSMQRHGTSTAPETVSIASTARVAW